MAGRNGGRDQLGLTGIAGLTAAVLGLIATVWLAWSPCEAGECAGRERTAVDVAALDSTAAASEWSDSAGDARGRKRARNDHGASAAHSSAASSAVTNEPVTIARAEQQPAAPVGVGATILPAPSAPTESAPRDKGATEKGAGDSDVVAAIEPESAAPSPQQPEGQASAGTRPADDSNAAPEPPADTAANAQPRAGDDAQAPAADALPADAQPAAAAEAASAPPPQDAEKKDSEPAKAADAVATDGEKANAAASAEAAARKAEKVAASAEAAARKVESAAAAARKDQTVVAMATPPKDVPPMASPKDLSGIWDLNEAIDTTTYRPYLGLRVGYRLRLQQKGSKVIGTGEKISENGRALPQSERTPIFLEGTVEGQTVKLNFTERSLGGHTTGGSLNWQIGSNGRLNGRFSSNAAKSSGISSARRLAVPVR